MNEIKLTPKEKETLEVLRQNAQEENPFPLYADIDKDVIRGFYDAHAYISYRLKKVYSLRDKGYVKIYKGRNPETHHLRTLCEVLDMPKKGRWA